MKTTRSPSAAIAAWRERMGLSQRAAAEALGLALTAFQELERGATFKPGGQPRRVKRSILLACAALEKKIEPIV